MTSKKDYILWAEALRSQMMLYDRQSPEHLAIGLTARMVANFFKLDNPKFDKQKFLTASGVITKPEKVLK